MRSASRVRTPLGSPALLRCVEVVAHTVECGRPACACPLHPLSPTMGEHCLENSPPRSEMHTRSSGDFHVEVPSSPKGDYPVLIDCHSLAVVFPPGEWVKNTDSSSESLHFSRRLSWAGTGHSFSHSVAPGPGAVTPPGKAHASPTPPASETLGRAPWSVH